MVTTLPLASIQASNRFRHHLGDLSGLARSIRDLGLLHPVVVNRDGVLVAGQRRLEACRLLGWSEVPVTVVDLAEVARGEYAENVERQNFLPSEAVAIAAALRPAEEERARERQLASLKRGDEKPVVEIFHDGGKTRDKAAAYAGLSGRTLEKAEAVVASGNAELVKLMDDTGRVNRAFKELRKSEARARLVEQPLPAGFYRVLYADPPWFYSGEQHGHEEQVTVLATHYPSMPLEALCALPVRDLALDNAVLFLWATSPMLEAALQVVRAWDFNYKTSMVWDKIAHNVGHYVSVRHELLLIATRGSCTPDVRVLHDSVYSEERTEHSQKPAYFRQLIDELYPHGPRIELFARGPAAPGWAVWGAEAQAS